MQQPTEYQAEEHLHALRGEIDLIRRGAGVTLSTQQRFDQLFNTDSGEIGELEQALTLQDPLHTASELADVTYNAITLPQRDLLEVVFTIGQTLGLDRVQTLGVAIVKYGLRMKGRKDIDEENRQIGKYLATIGVSLTNYDETQGILQDLISSQEAYQSVLE